jgi:hypothetical protein
MPLRRNKRYNRRLNHGYWFIGPNHHKAKCHELKLRNQKSNI